MAPFENDGKVMRSADAILSKKSSKRGLTRRPLFLVRVESLVCTVEIIGPSRSAGAGRDALPRVRRRAFIGREQHKKGENKQKGLQRPFQTRNAGRAGARTLPTSLARNACLTRNAESRGSASRPQRPRLIKSANPG